MIFFKSHESDHGAILAMCDKELIGRVLKSGKIYVDLDKYASFYKGSLVSEEEASRLVDKEDIYSANVVGTRSVAIMISKGLAGKAQIKKVGDVPFVQVYKLDVL